MKKTFLIIAGLLLSIIGINASAAGDASAGEDKVMMCMGCHGSDGNSMVPAFPKLAGLGEKYITQQLRMVKSGERVIMEMTGILDASTDQDLQDMAAYYDAQVRTVAGAEDISLVGMSDPQEVLKLGENLRMECPASVVELVEANIGFCLELAVHIPAHLAINPLLTNFTRVELVRGRIGIITRPRRDII